MSQSWQRGTHVWWKHAGDSYFRYMPVQAAQHLFAKIATLVSWSPVKHLSLNRL